VSKDMEIKRVEDNLALCKQRKGFLDELAVSAGKKSLITPANVVNNVTNIRTNMSLAGATLKNVVTK